jgi:4-diphosphocytidyl-2-C-methyl-D-erythritol kinase
MKLAACAKINRSLAVLGVRPDGYHELRTVFQSLALHDTLEFDLGERGLTIDCPTPGVPRDERNLVWKAARLVWQEAGRAGEPSGRVRLTKRIPAQGGLGGGSADGAAAPVGGNRTWGTALPDDRLLALAARLGADVPFFLCGGTALGLNRGDAIEPLDDMPPRWVVLVFPPFGVSTPEAFRWWDEDNPAFGLRHQALGCAAEGRTPSAESRTCANDLEGPVARRHPELLEIRRQLDLAGAEQAAMTGSGSTMFGLFEAEPVALHAADALRSLSWTVLVSRTATRQEAALR